VRRDEPLVGCLDAIARFQKVWTSFCGSREAGKSRTASSRSTSPGESCDRGNQQAVHRVALWRREVGPARDLAEPLAQLLARRRALQEGRVRPRPRSRSTGSTRPRADNDPDLPVALFNAAFSYKLADKPKTAIALFKEFTEKKAKNFQDSPFY